MSRKEIINVNNIVFLLSGIALLRYSTTFDAIALGKGFFVVAAVNLVVNNLMKK